ncbi:hypothetical protein A4G19_09105 [Pasteurellaceae bacterium Macca]|nr:hypothetical protein [Pasteurellaceae bacterium Macca]
MKVTKLFLGFLILFSVFLFVDFSFVFINYFYTNRIDLSTMNIVDDLFYASNTFLFQLILSKLLKNNKDINSKK